MNRITTTFNYLKKNNKKAVGFFLTAGFPNPKISEKILNQIILSNADFIEIGIPFSDPMADGPLIQKASEIALKNGMNLKKCIDIVRKVRKSDTKKPIIAMGYYNPIYCYGTKKFIKIAKKIGIDGLIIVDLPPEEDNELYTEASKYNLTVIRLISPTTNYKRLKNITKDAKGFLYYVSITGITGTKSANLKEVEKNVEIIKSITNLPIVVGFGIKSPSQAKQMCKFSDGIVVGSALVEILQKDLNSSMSSLISNDYLNFISSFKT